VAVPYTYENTSSHDKYIVYYRQFGVSVAIDEIPPGETWAKDSSVECVDRVKVYDTEKEAERYWDRLHGK
jgi:hypothetical protein